MAQQPANVASDGGATGVDAKLIQTIWPYVRSDQKMPGPGMIQNEGAEIAMELKQEIESSIAAIQVNIEHIEATNAGVVASAAAEGQFQMG